MATSRPGKQMSPPKAENSARGEPPGNEADSEELAEGRRRRNAKPASLSPKRRFCLPDEIEPYNLISKGRERERKRIAQELHDGVLQSLVSIKLELDQITCEIRRSVSEDLASDISDLANRVSSCVKEIRATAADLEPPDLRSVGALQALHQCVDTFSARHSVQILRDIETIRVELTSAQKLGLFRILQEALNNVTKHAHATRVEVRLQQASDALILQVRDDGRGMHPIVDDYRHYGLKNMRNRAMALGGSLTIESPLSQGVVVTAKIPLQDGQRKDRETSQKS